MRPSLERLTIAALVILGVGIGCSRETEPEPEPEPAPSLEAEAEAPPVLAEGRVLDLDGEPVDPLATEGAKATVLFFVSTHCPIANRYAPTMRRLFEGWQAQGVAAYLVYPDPDDEPVAIREHQAEYALPLPAVRDPAHLLVQRAGVRVTPEAAVFGPGTSAPAYRGRIDDRAVEFGKVRAEATTHELSDAVVAVLAGERPQPAAGPAIGCYISDLR